MKIRNTDPWHYVCIPCCAENAISAFTHSKIGKIRECVRKQELTSMSLPVKGWRVFGVTAILIGKTIADTAQSLHSMRLLWKAQVFWRTFNILLHITLWMALLFLISDNGLQDAENLFPAFSPVVRVADSNQFQDVMCFWWCKGERASQS